MTATGAGGLSSTMGFSKDSGGKEESADATDSSAALAATASRVVIHKKTDALVCKTNRNSVILAVSVTTLFLFLHSNFYRNMIIGYTCL